MKNKISLSTNRQFKLKSGVLLISTLLAANSAHALTADGITYFGALSNFDAVNNTQSDTNGFEIEMDGITSSQVTYTFDYQSYGKPRLIDDTFNGQPRVRVRYESKYDPIKKAFNNSTGVNTNASFQTGGHQCVSWPQPTSHNTGGCEHFGLGITAQPTKTIYRWLVADTNNPGSLTYQTDPLTKASTVVSIPAPIFAVNPPPPPPVPVPVVPIVPPPPPIVNNKPAPPVPPVAIPPAPIVQMVIEVPEPVEAPEKVTSEVQFGKAMWVKVFTTENPEPRDLNDLVTEDQNGKPGAKVPREGAEIEWQLLQKTLDPAKLAEGGTRDKLEQDKPVNAKDNSVTRRYEFYEYVGEFDTTTHEVLNETAITDPSAGAVTVGNYIGAQMVAINLLDVDSDGVQDTTDNCLLKPNKDQKDSDGDGYGNACDADFNNDFIVDAKDVGLLKKNFFKKTVGQVEMYDLNGDKKINTADLAVMKSSMKQSPGPGAAKVAPAP